MVLDQIKNLLEKAEEAYKKTDTDLLGTLATDARQQIEKYRETHPEELHKTARLYAQVLSHCCSYYSLTGRLDECVQQAQVALELLDQDDLPEVRASLLHQLGTAYRDLSDYTKALQYDEQALMVWQQQGNVHGVNSIMGSIAGSYYYLGEFDKALASCESVKNYFEEANDVNYLAIALGNLAVVCNSVGKYAEAMQHLERAMEINKALGNKRFVAINAQNMGGAYQGLKQFGKAKEFLELAIELDQDTKGISSAALFALGGLYRDESNPEKDYLTALHYMQRSVEIAETKNDLTGLSNFYFGLSDTFSLLNDFENAFKYHKLGYDTEKKVKSEEARRTATQTDYRRKIEEADRDRQLKLARFQEQEKILFNILPPSIAEQIVKGGDKIIKHHPHATVLFADIVGFTYWSKNRTISEVAETLNQIFNLFDELANRFGVEKIKTIGDAYMCVAGLPEPTEDHARRMAKMSIAMNQKIQETYPDGSIRLRIGIHCGEVIAGVLGKNRYAYDLWGDTVNTASRMESQGQAGKIQVSEDYFKLLSSEFNFEPRGKVEVKGKGEMNTWFLIG